VFGRDGLAHALVEEERVGVALEAALEALRARLEQLPVEGALAIAAELVGLWRAVPPALPPELDAIATRRPMTRTARS